MSIVVASPALGEALKEAERLLESGSNEGIKDVLAPVIAASYPPPRTRPNVRVILPILLDVLCDCNKEEGDRRLVRKYVIGFLRREFPEIFPFTSQGSTMNSHVKKNKNRDKYNKETRPEKWQKPTGVQRIPRDAVF